MSDGHGKKKALGRGLSALLEGSEQEPGGQKEYTPEYNTGSVNMIPVSQIEPNPFQPRTHFSEPELAELSISIREQGIIQPITLRKLKHDSYQVIAGERRLKASKMAGLTEVPAYIRLANDEQMLEMALVENIQREELNPLEIAISFQRLLEECKIRQEDLSQKVGKDRSTVSNYIRLLKLPAEIQVAVRDGLITMGHARAIINVEDEKIQLLMLQRILEQKLSVRKIEEMVRHSLNAGPKKKKTEPSSLPPRFEKVKSMLDARLQARVDVKLSRGGAGSIIIPFRSDEEFDRIISKLEE
jgi:ParB family chromosome partitioning protein